MAQAAAPARFRAMPLSELLDEVFRLYRRYFSVIGGVSLIVILPGLIWSLITGSYRVGLATYINALRVQVPGTTVVQLTPQQLNDFIGAAVLGLIGGLLLAPFTIGAVYRAASDAAQARPATIGSVLRATAGRYLPLLGLIGVLVLLLIAFYIALLIGFLLLVLPGFVVLGLEIWMAVRWTPTLAAMMTEDIGPIAGLKRSWNLTRGQWWRIVGILIVVGILQVVISFGLGLLFGGIAALVPGLDEPSRLALVQVVTTLLNAAVTPIGIIAITLLYFDLRVRNEGYDLDQLAQQTGPATS